MPIRIVKSNVLSVDPSSERNEFLFLSDEGPTLETLDFTIRIGTQYTNLFIFRFVNDDSINCGVLS